MINTKWNSPPLLSWDLARDGFDRLQCRERHRKDLDILDRLANNWDWDWVSGQFLDIDYDALVLTTATGTICWVSDGFTEMTGYNPEETLGRKPSFLQGTGTSEDTRAEIRRALRIEKPHTHTLVNYRKNGEAYRCEIRIIPIRNRDRKLTHFLAFEREVA